MSETALTTAPTKRGAARTGNRLSRCQLEKIMIRFYKAGKGMSFFAGYLNVLEDADHKTLFEALPDRAEEIIRKNGWDLEEFRAGSEYYKLQEALA